MGSRTAQTSTDNARMAKTDAWMEFRFAGAKFRQGGSRCAQSRGFGTAIGFNMTAQRLTQRTDVVRIDEVGRRPAVEVVFGHAAVGEALPPLVLARRDGRQ